MELEEFCCLRGKVQETSPANCQVTREFKGTQTRTAIGHIWRSNSKFFASRHRVTTGQTCQGENKQAQEIWVLFSSSGWVRSCSTDHRKIQPPSAPTPHVWTPGFAPKWNNTKNCCDKRMEIKEIQRKDQMSKYNGGSNYKKNNYY